MTTVYILLGINLSLLLGLLSIYLIYYFRKKDIKQDDLLKKAFTDKNVVKDGYFYKNVESGEVFIKKKDGKKEPLMKINDYIDYKSNEFKF